MLSFIKTDNILHLFMYFPTVSMQYLHRCVNKSGLVQSCMHIRLIIIHIIIFYQEKMSKNLKFKQDFIKNIWIVFNGFKNNIIMSSYLLYQQKHLKKIMAQFQFFIENICIFFLNLQIINYLSIMIMCPTILISLGLFLKNCGQISLYKKL